MRSTAHSSGHRITALLLLLLSTVDRLKRRSVESVSGGLSVTRGRSLILLTGLGTVAKAAKTVPASGLRGLNIIALHLRHSVRADSPVLHLVRPVAVRVLSSRRGNRSCVGLLLLVVGRVRIRGGAPRGLLGALARALLIAALASAALRRHLSVVFCSKSVRCGS